MIKDWAARARICLLPLPRWCVGYAYRCGGADGNWMVDRLARDGVNTDAITRVEDASGHALIMVGRRAKTP